MLNSEMACACACAQVYEEKKHSSNNVQDHAIGVLHKVQTIVLLLSSNIVYIILAQIATTSYQIM